MNIQVFSKKKFGQMRGYAEGNTVYLNVADIAVGLGFLKNDGSIRLTKINRLLKKFGYPAAVGENDYIPENMFYRLAMKADNPNAEGFQGWLANKVIPSIRQTGTYTVKTVAPVAALPSPVNAIRQENISTRKSFTAVVQLFILYARGQGDNRPQEKLYSKFTVLANQCAGIVNGGRPTATPKQLLICQQVENLIGNILLKGMDEDKHFARIESAFILSVSQFAKYIEPTLPLLN